MNERWHPMMFLVIYPLIAAAGIIALLWLISVML